MVGVAGWIEKRAAITPERVALIGEDRQLTYREMNSEVNRVARLLAEKYGLQTGERVGILAGNSIDYLLLLFAIAKLGAIAVVLNIRLTPRELSFQLSDSGTRLLVAERTQQANVQQMIAETEVEYVLWFSGQSESSERLCQQAVCMSHLPFTVTGVDGASPFIICYTSGTTGRPKGAVLTQENMFWNAVNNVLALDLTFQDKSLTLLPLFHIGGIGLFALPTLFAGGTVIVPFRFEPDQALKLIEEHGATIIMGVPTIYDLVRKSPNFGSTDFSSVRWFYTGGAPCPAELQTYYLERGLPFAQGFGMTETSPTVFMTPREDIECKIGSIGKPVMFCDIRVVDDAGNDVPAGSVGELRIKGPNLMSGYWNLPDATEAAFQDGWLVTGDLVTQDEDGFVYIIGRKKDMIISGGENVYPLEVEQVLQELAEVEEAAVIGVEHPKWGEVPLAVVALKAGMELGDEAIRAHCLTRLAKYKVPSRVIFVSALPKNATGKIDKKRITQSVAHQEEERRNG